MAQLLLEIVTPDRVLLSAQVDYVSLPGAEGEFGILPGHVPFFAALKLGCMHYQVRGETMYACVSGGFAEISGNKVLILADTAELAAEIDEDRAKAALKRAEDRLSAARRDKINITRAEAALQRAITRLHAVTMIR